MEYMTIAEVRQQYRVSRTFVHARMKDGTFAFRRNSDRVTKDPRGQPCASGRVLISRASVAAWDSKRWGDEFI
jgi:hypothetical protein